MENSLSNLMKVGLWKVVLLPFRENIYCTKVKMLNCLMKRRISIYYYFTNRWSKITPLQNALTNGQTTQYFDVLF